MIKGIIFDFDGVISESLEVKSKAFEEIYKPYGRDIVKKVLEHHESNGGVSRYEKFSFYHNFFLNKNITKKEISILSKNFSTLVVEKVIDAAYVPGALEYIKKSFSNYQLFISTGTPLEEIKIILNKKNIRKYFKEVFGSPLNKTTHINIIMKKYNLNPSQLVFFGDSNTDLEAAENYNIDFTLISNNYNKKLKSNYNGKIIKNFLELLN